MRILVRAAVCGLVLLGAAAPARAEIIFNFHDPGALQPEENLLFNEPGLLNTGLMVQGVTNNTATIIDISGHETLVADGGQARVVSNDNGFQWMLIEAHDPAVYFSEFEANLMIYSPPGPAESGRVRVTVTNNHGDIETGDYIVDGAGQNYFSLLAISDQLIRSILIESNFDPDNIVDIADIRQIRLGGVTTQNPPTSVPEPATMAVFGFGLLMGGRRLRRR